MNLTRQMTNLCQKISSTVENLTLRKMNCSSLHCTSLVLLLACLVLFTQIIHSSIAQTLSLTGIDQFQPNMITVACQDVPSGPYTFTFTSPDGSSEVRPPVTQNTPSYTFSVTPNNETNVTCRGRTTSQSTPITFAGEKNFDRLD